MANAVNELQSFEGVLFARLVDGCTYDCIRGIRLKKLPDPFSVITYYGLVVWWNKADTKYKLHYVCDKLVLFYVKKCFGYRMAIFSTSM